MRKITLVGMGRKVDLKFGMGRKVENKVQSMDVAENWHRLLGWIKKL